jgi:hypothetical protein
VGDVGEPKGCKGFGFVAPKGPKEGIFGLGDAGTPTVGKAPGLGVTVDPTTGGVGNNCDEDTGGVGSIGDGLGKGAIATGDCSVGVAAGLVEVAISGLGAFLSSSFIAAAVAPTVSNSSAAVFAQAGDVWSRATKPFFWAGLRVGKATISSAY